MLAEAIGALHRCRPALVAIGASAGAVEALGALLPPLPATFPVPLIVVVHVPADRPSALPSLLASTSALRIVDAEDKMTLEPGALYVAPPDYHLLVEHGQMTALSADAPVHNCRPSIDVLFESVADACGSHAVGILLSGANADGATGLAMMHRSGATTWVQRPETARATAMPEAALALAAHPTFTPALMGRALADWAHSRG